MGGNKEKDQEDPGQDNHDASREDNGGRHDATASTVMMDILQRDKALAALKKARTHRSAKKPSKKKAASGKSQKPAKDTVPKTIVTRSKSKEKHSKPPKSKVPSQENSNNVLDSLEQRDAIKEWNNMMDGFQENGIEVQDQMIPTRSRSRSPLPSVHSQASAGKRSRSSRSGSLSQKKHSTPKHSQAGAGEKSRSASVKDSSSPRKPSGTRPLQSVVTVPRLTRREREARDYARFQDQQRGRDRARHPSHTHPPTRTAQARDTRSRSPRESFRAPAPRRDDRDSVHRHNISRSVSRQPSYTEYTPDRSMSFHDRSHRPVYTRFEERRSRSPRRGPGDDPYARRETGHYERRDRSQSRDPRSAFNERSYRNPSAYRDYGRYDTDRHSPSRMSYADFTRSYHSQDRDFYREGARPRTAPSTYTTPRSDWPPVTPVSRDRFHSNRRSQDMIQPHRYEVPPPPDTGFDLPDEYDFAAPSYAPMVGVQPYNHVQERERTRIREGSYVSFSRLLRPLDRDAGYEFLVEDEGDRKRFKFQRGETRKVTDWDTWLEAFSVFTALHTRYYPQDALPLLQYQEYIRTLWKMGGDFTEYDERFRRARADNPYLPWTYIWENAYHTSNVSGLKKTINQLKEELQKAISSMTPSNAHNNAKGNFKKKGKPNTNRTPGYCWPYQLGRCRDPQNCTRGLHLCTRCNLPHPENQCRSHTDNQNNGNGNNGNNNNNSGNNGNNSRGNSVNRGNNNSNGNSNSRGSGGSGASSGRN